MDLKTILSKGTPHEKRNRVGRGIGSGNGKTCGRGHKGAGSRSGYKRRPAFEGGQMPLFRRMPKRGFSNAAFRTEFHIVNVGAIQERFKDGDTVDATSLAASGLIRDTHLPVKVLGQGELSIKVDVTANRFSGSAREKIEKSGGSVQVIVKKKWTRPATVKAAPVSDAADEADGEVTED